MYPAFRAAGLGVGPGLASHFAQLFGSKVHSAHFQCLHLPAKKVEDPQSSAANLPPSIHTGDTSLVNAGCGPAEGRRAAGGAGESESRGHFDEAKAAELSAGAGDAFVATWDMDPPQLG